MKYYHKKRLMTVLCWFLVWHYISCGWGRWLGRTIAWCQVKQLYFCKWNFVRMFCQSKLTFVFKYSGRWIHLVTKHQKIQEKAWHYCLTADSYWCIHCNDCSTGFLCTKATNVPNWKQSRIFESWNKHEPFFFYLPGWAFYSK